MDIPLAFLNGISYAILDLDDNSLSWNNDECTFVDELKQKAAVDGFDFYYLSTLLVIAISDSKYAIFEYQMKGGYCLVMSLFLPKYNWLKNNISLVRELVEEFE